MNFAMCAKRKIIQIFRFNSQFVFYTEVSLYSKSPSRNAIIIFVHNI